MHRLRVEHASKTFPGNIRALDDVSFSVAPGEFFSIVGPTNAGKSTLLKMIAGLCRADAGRVVMDGEDVSQLEPRLRHVSLLFQNIALFPTLNGFDNIAYSLKLAGMAGDVIARRVDEVAKLVNVRHLLDRLPRTFSGGEQQRVAIARALALDSRLLMLDEPLTNLDARLRIALRREFKALHRQGGSTIIYVTHDQAEAMSLSDRLLVLNAGKVEQIGTPQEIYARPATRFVAEFVGTPPMNILEAEASVGGASFVLPGCDAHLPGNGDLDVRLPASLSIGIRPEDIVAAQAPSESTPIPGQVMWVERFGSRNVLNVSVGSQFMRVATRPDHPVQEAGSGWFGFQPGRQRILDRQSNRFLYPVE